jgi:hypothetical protein
MHQHTPTSASLKTVSAATPKQETNVFPNGHPLLFHLCYPGIIVREILCQHSLPTLFVGDMLCHVPLIDMREAVSITHTTIFRLSNL